VDIKELKKTFWWGILLILVIPIVLLIFVFCNQGIDGVQEWLIPLSGFVSLITVAIGSWLAVNNYRLSIKAEKRLNDSSTIESNIRLLTLFSKMMQIANCRYDPILSEKVIEGLFQNKIITENDFKDKASIEKVSKKLELSLLEPVYGLATQKAAIGAIYTLGKEHNILCDAAIDGLKEVKDIFMQSNRNYEFIEKYIDDLKKIKAKAANSQSVIRAA